jgi:hypothetical protein
MAVNASVMCCYVAYIVKSQSFLSPEEVKRQSDR